MRKAYSKAGANAQPNTKRKYPKNPLPCGCGAVGTPEINWDGTRVEHRNIHVRHCPLHAAAEDMLKALQKVQEWLLEGGEPIEGISNPLFCEAYAIVRKAIQSATKPAGERPENTPDPEMDRVAKEGEGGENV